jgi:hypothetical protein
MNDIQMRWHASEVSQAREERGEQAANALWLHGGGSWRHLPPSRFARVGSDDPVLQGWQHASRPPAGLGPDDTLDVWPSLFEPYWRKDWSAWADAWDGLQRRLQDRPGQAWRPAELIACGRRDAAAFRLGGSWSRFAPPRRGLRDCLVQSPA